jgi:tRNA(Arg) A34 adenosine deaminase TadA
MMRSASGAAATGPTGSAPTEADQHWMGLALRQAARAGAAGEVPVGALVVREGRVLGSARNASIATHDPSGHAEVRALRAAGRRAGNYRLPGAVLYVTVEPCAMCMGAAVQARVARLVYGCSDPKGGAAGSLFDLSNDPRLNHRMAVTPGVNAQGARELLQRFFRVRRTS